MILVYQVRAMDKATGNNIAEIIFQERADALEHKRVLEEDGQVHALVLARILIERVPKIQFTYIKETKAKYFNQRWVTSTTRGIQ